MSPQVEVGSHVRRVVGACDDCHTPLQRPFQHDLGGAAPVSVRNRLYDRVGEH